MNITQLIQHRLKVLSLTRGQLAQRLGSHPTKILRRLDHYCHTLEDSSKISNRLANALEINEDILYQVIQQRRSEIQERERQSFQPYIQTIMSIQPSPIFAAAAMVETWQISLPDLDGLSYEEEILKVQEAYRDHQIKVHQQRTQNEFAGDFHDYLKWAEANTIPHWTIANGFRYFRNYQETLIFNQAGDYISTERDSQEGIKINYTI